MRWFFEVVPRPLASGSQNLVTFGIRWVTGSTDWWLNSPGASFLAINGDRYWCNNKLKTYCFRRGVWPGFGHGSCNGNWGSNIFRPCAAQVVAFTGRPLVSLAKESLVVFHGFSGGICWASRPNPAAKHGSWVGRKFLGPLSHVTSTHFHVLNG